MASRRYFKLAGESIRAPGEQAKPRRFSYSYGSTVDAGVDYPLLTEIAMNKLEKDEIAAAYQKKHLDNWPLNWRAWGSWFSWGSPVGLGLFFIELAGAVWILFHLR